MLLRLFNTVRNIFFIIARIPKYSCINSWAEYERVDCLDGQQYNNSKEVVNLIYARNE